jgi:hypothetical protein
MPGLKHPIKRYFFVTVGSVSVGLGVIGIIVPVLPTTPFLLLGAACYLRGSQRLYDRLLCNRFLGCYIRNYMEGRGIPLKMKIWTLVLLWAVMISTAVLATGSLTVRIILGVILVGVSIYILSRKTAAGCVGPGESEKPPAF